MLKELKGLLRIKWTNDHRLFLILGILGSILVFGLQQWVDIKIIEQKQLAQYAPIWFFTGMTIGFGQELAFRGLIYTALFKKHGTKWAAIISTLCFVFGLIHSARLYSYFSKGYIFEPLLLASIFLLAGLFFLWVRIKTKNIIIPAVIHGVGNAITWATFVVVKLNTLS